jgi:hypothetical protein
VTSPWWGSVGVGAPSRAWVEKFDARKGDKTEDVDDVFSVSMNVADTYMLARQFEVRLDFAGVLPIWRARLTTAMPSRCSFGVGGSPPAAGELDKAVAAIRDAVQLEDSLPPTRTCARR